MSGERGEMSLTGLLMSMTLSLVILGATLVAFQGSERINRETQIRLEAQDRARVAVEDVARRLRNLASPTGSSGQVVERATAYDLIFQSVDPLGPNSGQNKSNVQRLRYCLDGSGRLWSMRQTWTTAAPPAPPATTLCDGSGGWSAPTVAAADVVNRAGDQPPVFTYDDPDPLRVASIHADLLIDVDPARAPAATRLSSGVFLRNQNRRPVAAFVAVISAQGIVLNASSSYDPEGDQLSYEWYDAGVRVGEGAVFIYADNASGPLVHGSDHDLSLVAIDRSNLSTTSATQRVRFP